jgi:hypothetical protein
MPTHPEQTEVPFYSDDLFPDLQRTLAILADLETRYEIARDRLERWSGPTEVKDRLLADVEQRYRAKREPLMTCLEGVRLNRRGLVSGTPRRIDH